MCDPCVRSFDEKHCLANYYKNTWNSAADKESTPIDLIHRGWTRLQTPTREMCVWKREGTAEYSGMDSVMFPFICPPAFKTQRQTFALILQPSELRRCPVSKCTLKIPLWNKKRSRCVYLFQITYRCVLNIRRVRRDLNKPTGCNFEICRVVAVCCEPTEEKRGGDVLLIG